MNENLNLVEILKDYPKGTKLYSTTYGDVELIRVNQNDDVDYPIEIKLSDDSINSVTTDGRLCEYYNGECVLFPSREQRDWSKFKLECLKAADAEPNLESLWHDATEEPQYKNKRILAYSEYFDRFFVDSPSYLMIKDGGQFKNWETVVLRNKISKWAYISDLFPKGGEQ